MSTKPGPDPTAGPDSSWSGRLRRWPDWLALLPLNLILLSVLVLAGYTTSVNFRVEAERDVSEKVLVPALRAAQDLMIHAALELEGLYQYTLTGDPVALSDYHESMDGRRVATAALVPLAQGLQGTARKHSDTLLYLANRWNATAPDPAGLSRLEPADREEYLRHVQVLYRAIIMQTAVLQDQLRADIDASRAQVRTAERLIWYFTLGLAALALTAALLVRWLVRRMRGLAAVSEHRRHEAETAMDHRSRLLRGITHDVKNPLGAADGSAQLLQMGVGGELTDGQQESPTSSPTRSSTLRKEDASRSPPARAARRRRRSIPNRSRSPSPIRDWESRWTSRNRSSRSSIDPVPLWSGQRVSGSGCRSAAESLGC